MRRDLRSFTLSSGARASVPSVLVDRLSPRAGLLACLALTLLLRAPYLHATLGIDEGGLAYVAQHWDDGDGSLYGAHWVDRPPLLLALFRVAVVAGAVGVHALGAVAALALVAVVFAIGREVAGPGTALVAALLAALLAGSPALGAVHTPAELLAAVPSAASVLALLVAHRTGRARWLAVAGALAVSALLIKQSFLDAALAGIAFALFTPAPAGRARRLAAYAAGAAAPLAGVLAWTAVAGVSVGQLAYAVVGFRLDALHTLAASNLSLQDRLAGLSRPAVASGLVVLLVLAVGGVARLRRRRVVALVLGVWMAAATVGILGGGSYWPHYLIELVPAVCVAAGHALATLGPSPRRVAVVALAAFGLFMAVSGAVAYHRLEPHRPELQVARYVREHARPGDTQYVMYARANLAFYDGLPSPFPYAWSLMIRSYPGARARLDRLLGSAQRPTWVVQWQDDDRWRLDHAERVDRLLAGGYRRVATVAGHPIFLRDDRVLA